MAAASVSVVVHMVVGWTSTVSPIGHWAPTVPPPDKVTGGKANVQESIVPSAVTSTVCIPAGTVVLVTDTVAVNWSWQPRVVQAMDPNGLLLHPATGTPSTAVMSIDRPPQRPALVVARPQTPPSIRSMLML
jgi:hypothetical protein